MLGMSGPRKSYIPGFPNRKPRAELGSREPLLSFADFFLQHSFIVPPRAVHKSGESPRAAFHRAPETRSRAAGRRGNEPEPATSEEWYWRARSIRAWLLRRDPVLRWGSR